MRRKNLTTAIICTFCLAVSAVSPMAAAAEETELTTEAAAEDGEAEADDAEAQGADGDAGVEAQDADGDAEDADAEAQDADGDAGAEAQDADGDADAEAQDADGDAEDADGESTDAEGAQASAERPDYTALDYVTLGEYKGLTIGLGLLTVSDEEVASEIRSRMKNAEMTETLEEGTVQEGDIANIDYEGKLNGDAFDGGTAKGTDLEIGSGTFIPGFEDGLIGVSVGETVDLPLTFPESYRNTELAGKETVFTVTVNEIQRVSELTDENVGTLTDGEYSDAESYRASVREELEANKDSNKESIIKSEAMRQLEETSTINGYPQEMIDYSVTNLIASAQEQADNYSMELGDFLSAAFGMTEEQYREQAAEYAKQMLAQEMILKAVAETEGIEVSDEEYAEGCERYLANEEEYETTEEMEAAYGEKIIRLSILQDKVLDFLADNAVVEQETEMESESETGASVEETEAETAAE